MTNETTKNYKKFEYKNITVEVFNGYDGDQIFLSNGYSARTNRNQGVARAKEIVDGFEPKRKVAQHPTMQRDVANFIAEQLKTAHKNYICQNCGGKGYADFCSNYCSVEYYAGVLQNESCGCVINWDDKFTDYCPKHLAEREEEEIEWMMRG